MVEWDLGRSVPVQDEVVVVVGRWRNIGVAAGKMLGFA